MNQILYNHIYEFIVDKPQFYDEYIFTQITNSLHVLVNSLYISCHALLHLLCFLSVIVFKIIFLSLPYVLKFGESVIEFHRTQLNPSDMIVEAIVLICLLLYLIFRERIKKAWTVLEARVAQRSREAAKLAPHVMFFSVSILLSYFGRKFLIPLSSPSVMPVFTILIPLYNSLVTLIRELPFKYREHLVLWVILGVYYATCTIIIQIPFITYIYDHFQLVHVFGLVIVIWIQTSHICADIVFDYANPIIHYYMSKVPIPDIAYTSNLISYLKYTGISERILLNIQGLLSDSIALIVCCVFVFMPTRLANIGVVLVALLLPAYKTSTIINNRLRKEIPRTPSPAASIEQDAPNSSVIERIGGFFSPKPKAKVEKKKSPSPQSPDDPDNKDNDVMRKWLEYWACIAFLLLLQSYKMRLWPSSMMILSLWLQNTYFQGAHVSYKFVYNATIGIIVYNKRSRSNPNGASNLTEVSASSGSISSSISSSSESSRDIITSDVRQSHSAPSDDLDLDERKQL
jgi:hypothetical protein